MTTESIKTFSAAPALAGLLGDTARAAAALSAGWRAARDWRRLSIGAGVSQQPIARAVFERNFA